MIKKTAIICMILILVLLTGCTTAIEEFKPEAPPFPVTVRGVTLEREPKAIVSLSPVISYLIAQYGHSDRLSGRTDNCVKPEALKEIPSIGSDINPDMDKIIAANPDVVLTDRALTKRDVDKLSAAGIKLITVEPAVSIATLGYLYRDISLTLSGKTEEQAEYTPIEQTSEEYLRMFDALTSSALANVSAGGARKSFVFLSSVEGITAGKGTLESGVFSMIGKNAATHTGYSGDINAVIKANPDVILAASPMTVDKIKAVKGLSELSAVKNSKIYIVDMEAFNYRDAEGIARLLDEFSVKLK